MYIDIRLFSQRLRSEMDRAGIDASTLAKTLGFSKSSVSNWLNQKHGAQSYALELLGSYFGVAPAWLAGAIPDRTASPIRQQHVAEGEPTADNSSSADRSSEDNGSDAAPAEQRLQTAAVRERPAQQQTIQEMESLMHEAIRTQNLTEGNCTTIITFLKGTSDFRSTLGSIAQIISNKM